MQFNRWRQYKNELKQNNITLHTTPFLKDCVDDYVKGKFGVLCGCKRPRFASSGFKYIDYKESIKTKYFIMIDVTSGTARKHDKVFSPLIQPSDMSLCVETLWQSCKRYNPVDICRREEKLFWAQLKSPVAGGKNPRRSKVVAKFIAKHKKLPREVRYSFECAQNDLCKSV